MANDDKQKTVVAKLRCLAHRGETINTRWGEVAFDKDGLAELEVPEDEVQMLRDVKPHSWLVDDQPSYLASLDGELEKKPDKKTGAKK